MGNDIERSAGVSDDEAPGANGVSHFERMMPPRDSAAELPDSIADEDVEDGMSADDSDDAAPESDDESDFDDNDDDDDSDIDDDDDVDDDDLAINGHDEDRDVANSDASDDADHSHLDSRETPLPGSLMSGIPVTLTFELGDVSLSLGELSKIGPGVILEIIDGSPASIAITCSGKRLGKGEIVDVDGRLGIRITGWEQQC